MRRSVIVTFVAALGCMILSSCGISVQNGTPGKDEPVLVSSSKPNEGVEPTKMAEETPILEDKEEALFINEAILSINQSDCTFFQKYADYYIPSDGADGIQIGLTLLKESLLDREAIIGFETVEDSNIKLPAKLIRSYTEGGHSRCFIVYRDEQKGFRFSDPLITMSANIMKRAQSYVEAIKANDIEALYNYLVMVNEDADAKPYSEDEHNQGYVSAAKALVEKYQSQMLLDSLELRLLKVANDTTKFVSTVDLEYSVIGKSRDGKVVQHSIHGVFEAPITGILDEWFVDQVLMTQNAVEVNWQ